MEPVEAVERRPERDLRVQTPDLERSARVHFADFMSLYKIDFNKTRHFDITAGGLPTDKQADTSSNIFLSFDKSLSIIQFQLCKF